MFGGKSSFEPLISPSFLWMSAQIVPEFGHAPLKRRRRPSKAIVEKATLSKCISRFGFSDDPGRYIDWPGTYFTRLGTSLKHTETTSAADLTDALGLRA